MTHGQVNKIASRLILPPIWLAAGAMVVDAFQMDSQPTGKYLMVLQVGKPMA